MEFPPSGSAGDLPAESIAGCGWVPASEFDTSIDLQHRIQERVHDAYLRAATESRAPLFHGCLSVGGLVLVQCIRKVAWDFGEIPVRKFYLMHWTSILSDFFAIGCGVLIIALSAPEGRFVSSGYVTVGVMVLLTLLFLDVGATALVAFMQPWAAIPFGSKVFMIQFLKAACGAWNVSLCTSVALQLALCTSCWRFYRILHTTGLYPPGNDALLRGTPLPNDVSPSTLCFDEDELQSLNECHSCGQEQCIPLLQAPMQPAIPHSVVLHADTSSVDRIERFHGDMDELVMDVIALDEWVSARTRNNLGNVQYSSPSSDKDSVT